MIPWFKNVKPHKDIREGILDEAIFAANLSEVASGSGREIYLNPEVFFSKTYLTKGVINIAKRVIKGLNGGQDAENRVISLQTGFGGGKTHTLITLYHLTKWGKKAAESENAKELLSETGKPEYERANIAVFTNATNDPVQGRKVDGITLKTIWGDLAYQLGGKDAYEILRENDDKLTAPKGLFKKVLEKCKPSLILIDELADYCVSASAVNVGGSNLGDQTISFLQELTEAISGTDNCVLIATLPASAQELGASEKSTSILSSLENRITRIGANIKPVEDEEIYEVVRRRLFEDIGKNEEINKVVSRYLEFYQSIPSELPDYAVKTSYKELLYKSYPFHPELINMFRLRWASNPGFQRTRGVLRILAAIVSDLWKRQTSLTGNNSLIHTSDVNFSNLDALVSQITNLYGMGWDSVISSDVSGTSSKSFRIDDDVPSLGTHNTTQGISSTILLGTFGSEGQNKGVSLDELKLCVVKPDGYNHNDVNGALDRLEETAHYLYSSSGHKRYWFSTKPNINIIINTATNSIKNEEVISEIVNRLKETTNNVSGFNVIVDPSTEIPEQKNPTLIFLSPNYLANPNEVYNDTKNLIEKIATKKGNSERIYRNTILFIICSEVTSGKLFSDVKTFLGCKKVSSEYVSQLSDEQKKDIKGRIDESSKQINSSIISAYNILGKYTAKSGLEKLLITQFKDNMKTQIESNIYSSLKDDEWLIDAVGMNTLKSNSLFPQSDNPIRVIDVYNAFIRFDDKPMITGPNALSKSLLRYCMDGEICIATGDGIKFTNIYYKEEVPYFDIQDDTYWITDPSFKNRFDEKGEAIVPAATELAEEQEPGIVGEEDNQVDENARKIKSVTISGRVPFEQYTQIYQSFILPLVYNDIEIDIKIKGTSNNAKKLTESSQEYKVVKESAKQMGLNFEEEEE